MEREIILPLSAVPLTMSILPLDMSPVIVVPVVGVVITGADGGVVSDVMIHVTLPVMVSGKPIRLLQRYSFVSISVL
jgi:hypothetical protein